MAPWGDHDSGPNRKRPNCINNGEAVATGNGTASASTVKQHAGVRGITTQSAMVKQAFRLLDLPHKILLQIAGETVGHKTMLNLTHVSRLFCSITAEAMTKKLVIPKNSIAQAIKMLARYPHLIPKVNSINLGAYMAGHGEQCLCLNNTVFNRKARRLFRNSIPLNTNGTITWNRLHRHLKALDQTLTIAARAILPAWKTYPRWAFFRDAGLPSALIALEEAKLRFALHLQTVDKNHPLTARIEIPVIPRGRGAGGLQKPQSKVQRLGMILPTTPRHTLVAPHYSPGCRTDPTNGIAKADACNGAMG